MTHWEKKKERGSIFALRLVINIYRFLGNTITSVLLHPVVFYFFLTDFPARRASFEYLKQIDRALGKKTDKATLSFRSFKHLLSFGRKILHSLSAWLGEFHARDIDFTNREMVHAMADRHEGALVLGAHVGCLEGCRAAKKDNANFKIVPLMYLENGLKFRSFLKELDPKSEEEIILIEEGKHDVPMQVLSRIQKGEFVSILADRISPFAKDRSIELDFLGRPAKFPEGPFAMAYALNCPVLTFFTVYDETDKRYKAYWEKLDISDLIRTRSKRDENLKLIASRYVRRLEKLVKLYPYQWFNFFDFWE